MIRRKKPRGLGERVTVSSRVRGLQSVMEGGNEERSRHQELFNKLGRLRMEKGRLAKESQNWRGRLNELEQRLRAIGEEEILLEEHLRAQLGGKTLRRKAAPGNGKEAGCADESVAGEQDLVLHY